MSGLKAIKLKIRSVEKTQKVTKAMEAVSAAKMRKSQSLALGGRAYTQAAVSILARVAGTRDLVDHPLLAVRPIKKALYIVITSDKGLAGALNSAVLRGTLADMQATGLPTEDISIIAVGKKANEFFTKRGFLVETYYPNTDEVTNGLISGLVETSAGRFTAGFVDIVKIAYQNFVSTFVQQPITRIVFPLGIEELKKMVDDIHVGRRTETQSVNVKSPTMYTIEPSTEEVLNAVLPLLSSIFVYHVLLESQASEHSARMVAMKNASDKAEEMTHDLTLKFNKARQSLITREVSEITVGMEAMMA